MSFNPEESIRALYTDFQMLVEWTSDNERRTAKDVEAHLFENLLSLGAKLLQHYFESQASAQQKACSWSEGATRLPYHSQRRRSYFSVFGKIQFKRAYFWAPGQAGLAPLDRVLDLPENCYSALLCDWAAFAATEQSYEASQALIEHILRFRLPKRALEQIVSAQAEAVGAYYEEKAPPEAEAPILVIQADGKGVPMRGRAPSRVRRGKGEKRTQKKEAIVTTLYGIEPYRRRPAELVTALMRTQPAAELVEEPEAVPVDRPVPQAKHVWATLQGKDEALTHLARQAARRERSCIVDRVALSDGAQALQQRLAGQGSEYVQKPATSARVFTVTER